MRRCESAGPRQKDRDRNWGQQPKKGNGAKKGRLPVHDQIDGKHTERQKAAQEPRRYEGLMARKGQRVALCRLVNERMKIGDEPTDTLTAQHTLFGAADDRYAPGLSFTWIIRRPA